MAREKKLGFPRNRGRESGPQKRMGGVVPNAVASKGNAALEALGSGFAQKRKITPDGVATLRLRGDGSPLAVMFCEAKRGECCEMWWAEVPGTRSYHNPQIAPLRGEDGEKLALPFIYFREIASFQIETGGSVTLSPFNYMSEAFEEAVSEIDFSNQE